jgi:hypothetical protein
MLAQRLAGIELPLQVLYRQASKTNATALPALLQVTNQTLGHART